MHQTNRTHSSSLLLVLHLLILFPFIPSLLHQLPQPKFFPSLFPLHMQLMKESWVGCQMSLDLMLYDTFISLLLSFCLSFFLSFISPSFIAIFNTFCLPFTVFFPSNFSASLLCSRLFPILIYLFFTSSLFYFLSLSLLLVPTSLSWPSGSSLSHLLTTAASTNNNST